MGRSARKRFLGGRVAEACWGQAPGDRTSTRWRFQLSRGVTAPSVPDPVGPWAKGSRTRTGRDDVESHGASIVYRDGAARAS